MKHSTDFDDKEHGNDGKRFSMGVSQCPGRDFIAPHPEVYNGQYTGAFEDGVLVKSGYFTQAPQQVEITSRGTLAARHDGRACDHAQCPNPSSGRPKVSSPPRAIWSPPKSSLPRTPSTTDCQLPCKKVCLFCFFRLPMRPVTPEGPGRRCVKVCARDEDGLSRQR